MACFRRIGIAMLKDTSESESAARLGSEEWR